MHQNIPNEIDHGAPVIADHEVTIAAPLPLVWQLHVDVEAWPTWQRDITEATLESAFAPGVSFHWLTYGMEITSTIYALEPARRIVWGGAAGDIVGIHEWLFRETPGGVVVRTRESFAGPAVEAAGAGQMQALLDRSLIDWLARLKTTAEARHSARP
ncbi:SRPBCC family protein [Vulgatibacter incomptus]|uniref:Shy6-polyketide cyclase n=1 Tax=Vulgatibacter incomptus TaxID=1391653 RepID=A0A0K1PH65_9BACT|nr:SRPBCC family protein [Vulgatibacter incomptus]AKU92464.1 hypothetical protein AKJ08_2851 [Vulgatibacter incomptus]